MPDVAGPRTAKASESDVILHLLGRERMPIYFGMLQFKAGLHVFITTKDYQHAANVLSRCLPEACRSRTVNIQDPFKPDDTRTAIQRQVSKLPPAARVAVNLTGGTKLMFAGALAACWKRGLEPSYFEIENHNIIFIRDGVTAPFIGAKSVADFFVLTRFDVITNGRWEEEPLPRTTDGCNQRAAGCQTDAGQALPDVRVSQIAGSLGQEAEPAV